jgi:hypothetical protein
MESNNPDVCKYIKNTLQFTLEKWFCNSCNKQYKTLDKLLHTICLKNRHLKHNNYDWRLLGFKDYDWILYESDNNNQDEIEDGERICILINNDNINIRKYNIQYHKYSQQYIKYINNTYDYITDIELKQLHNSKIITQNDKYRRYISNMLDTHLNETNQLKLENSKYKNEIETNINQYIHSVEDWKKEIIQHYEYLINTKLQYVYNQVNTLKYKVDDNPELYRSDTFNIFDLRKDIESELRKDIESELRKNIESELRQSIESELDELYTEEYSLKYQNELEIKTYEIQQKYDIIYSDKEYLLKIKIRENLYTEIANDIESNYNCIVCYENRRDTCLNPCKHLSMCKNCASNISNCPICRCKIISTNKIYFS